MEELQHFVPFQAIKCRKLPLLQKKVKTCRFTAELTQTLPFWVNCASNSLFTEETQCTKFNFTTNQVVIIDDKIFFIEYSK